MMLPIQSSMFSHIGWADDTLTVQYHPSKKQREAGLPGDVWVYPNYVHGLPAEPPAAPEKGWGRWFLANIKGRYDGAKMPTDEEAAANDEWRRVAHPEMSNGKPITPVSVPMVACKSHPREIMASCCGCKMSVSCGKAPG